MTAVNVNTDGRNVVVKVPETNVVEVITAGPHGNTPSGIHVDDSAKVDSSIIYYDSSSDAYLANSTWTVETLVIGGNF